jgi:hypothetical protein
MAVAPEKAMQEIPITPWPLSKNNRPRINFVALPALKWVVGLLW